MSNYVYPTRTLPSYPRPVLPTETRTQLPTLEELVQSQRVLPAYSLILGLCDDNLPLVLDLTEAASGSFLIAGDSGFANTSLLHSVIAGAFLLNTEHEANIHLISPQADSLTHFHRQPNFKISYQTGRPECEIVLEEMVALVETRQRSGRLYPTHILCIDSLDLLWDSLSAKGKLWLNWLVTYGPASGLWVFATLDTDYLQPELHRAIDCFPSRILGNTQSQNQANYLSGFRRSSLQDLTPELEFNAYIGGQIFNLWLLKTELDR